MELEKCIVWFSIQNGGDGSAYNKWFLSSEEAEYDQDHMSSGWGECCMGSVETFVGSDIYNEALVNNEDEDNEEEEDEKVELIIEKPVDYRKLNLINERLELAYIDGPLSESERERLKEINILLESF